MPHVLCGPSVARPAAFVSPSPPPPTERYCTGAAEQNETFSLEAITGNGERSREASDDEGEGRGTGAAALRRAPPPRPPRRRRRRRLPHRRGIRCPDPLNLFRFHLGFGFVVCDWVVKLGS